MSPLQYLPIQCQSHVNASGQLYSYLFGTSLWGKATSLDGGGFGSIHSQFGNPPIHYNVNPGQPSSNHVSIQVNPVSIHPRSGTNLVAIWVNQLPIHCQFWTNLPMFGQHTNQMPILDLSANPGSIHQSNTNPPIHYQSANPIPICQSNTNPRLNRQSITNMPIHYQSANPLPICQYITNPPIQYQSVANLSIHYQFANL